MKGKGREEKEKEDLGAKNLKFNRPVTVPATKGPLRFP
jgi:hypothetical protein